MKAMTEQMIDKESDPYFATARLWDDGIIDPRDTRTVRRDRAIGGVLGAGARHDELGRVPPLNAQEQTNASSASTREAIRTLTPNALIDVGGGREPEPVTITCAPGTDSCSYRCTSYAVT